MARVVVTGGAGFIGSHVVDQFIARGDEVIVIDDLTSGKRQNIPAGVRLEVLDIRSDEARGLMTQLAPEIVVHAAAQMSVRVSMDEPAFDTHVNVTGLVNLLQGLKAAPKYPHFVFISTGGAIYGEQDTFPADEEHAIRPASVYGLSKRVSELYLEFWQRELGMNFVALRLGNVYGPRQNPHGEAGVIAIFCERLIDHKPCTIYGTGEQTRDFVFVADVARAVEAVAVQKVNGTFNIGTGVESNVKELFSGLASALKVTAAPLFGAPRSGEQLRSCIDPGRAYRKFGWKAQVGLAEGLKLTADWFASRRPIIP